MTQAEIARPRVSRGEDDRTLSVSVGDASIRIQGLRVAPMSNFRTPHQLVGVGDARIALTDLQLVQLLAEWLSFVLHDDAVHVIDDSTKLKFEVQVKR